MVRRANISRSRCSIYNTPNCISGVFRSATPNSSAPGPNLHIIMRNKRRKSSNHQAQETRIEISKINGARSRTGFSVYRGTPANIHHNEIIRHSENEAQGRKRANAKNQKEDRTTTLV